MNKFKIINLQKIQSALFFSLVFLFIANPAVFALNLDEAKAKGLVGEKPDGYLAPVQAGANQEVKQLVNEINSKRKQEYSSIASKNGTTLKAVEALAGKKAINKTAGGEYIQTPQGKWIKK